MQKTIILCCAAFILLISGYTDQNLWSEEKINTSDTINLQNQQPAAQLTEAQQRRWGGMQQMLQKEYQICIEECGKATNCLERCKKALNARLDREYKKITYIKSDVKPANPTEQEKCAVCGMFVAKYPQWVAQIIFKDNSRAFFDGAKDLFTYYFNLKQYNPKKTRNDIAALYVTAYYTAAPIDARYAYYVFGSDVYGPMGKELIPCATEAEATELKKDHKGEKIVTFNSITPKLLEALK
jgi:nitrous oxide reductase accessory protein NosL